MSGGGRGRAAPERVHERGARGGGAAHEHGPGRRGQAGDLGVVAAGEGDEQLDEQCARRVHQR